MYLGKGFIAVIAIFHRTVAGIDFKILPNLSKSLL